MADLSAALKEGASLETPGLGAGVQGASNKDLMTAARLALSGNWLLAILGYLLYTILLTSFLLFVFAVIFFIRAGAGDGDRGVTAVGGEQVGPGGAPLVLKFTGPGKPLFRGKRRQRYRLAGRNRRGGEMQDQRCRQAGTLVHVSVRPGWPRRRPLSRYLGLVPIPEVEIAIGRFVPSTLWRHIPVARFSHLASLISPGSGRNAAHRFSRVAYAKLNCCGAARSG